MEAGSKLMESGEIGELPKGTVGHSGQLVEKPNFNPWVDCSIPSETNVEENRNSSLIGPDV
jgi:hypothetical protein